MNKKHTKIRSVKSPQTLSAETREITNEDSSIQTHRLFNEKDSLEDIDKDDWYREEDELISDPGL